MIVCVVTSSARLRCENVKMPKDLQEFLTPLIRIGDQFTVTNPGNLPFYYVCFWSNTPSPQSADDATSFMDGPTCFDTWSHKQTTHLKIRKCRSLRISDYFNFLRD